jgi:hypothetical protein
VLAGVLLHVVTTPRAIDDSVDPIHTRISGQVVDDAPGLVFPYVDNRLPFDATRVVWLTTRGRIETGAVEQERHTTIREWAALDDPSLELESIRIVEVEPRFAGVLHHA